MTHERLTKDAVLKGTRRIGINALRTLLTSYDEPPVCTVMVGRRVVSSAQGFSPEQASQFLAVYPKARGAIAFPQGWYMVYESSCGNDKAVLLSHYVTLSLVKPTMNDRGIFIGLSDTIHVSWYTLEDRIKS